MRESLVPRWKLYLLSIFCMIGVSAFTGALAYSTKLIVNEVFVDGDTKAAFYVAGLVVLISFFKSLFEYGNGVLSVTFQRVIAAGYQRMLFQKLMEKDVWYLTRQHSATFMGRVQQLGAACGDVVVNVSNKLLTETLTLLALVGVMVMQDPLMSLISCIVFPLIFWIVGTLSKRIRSVAAEETELTGAYMGVGTEAFQGVRTVKSYGLEDKTYAKFDEAIDKLETRILGIAKITAATVPLLQFIGGLVLGGFVVYAAWQTLSMGKTPGEFTAFITAFLLAYQPAERISKVLVQIQKSVVQAGYMYEIIETPPTRPAAGDKTFPEGPGALEFDAVSFAYETAEDGVKALSEVNITLNPGEKIALVGRSGAGKSTLVDLVMRFYDPTSGHIRLAGTDLREVTDEAMRNAVALISQDVFLFEGTLRENILDGKPDAIDEELARAIEFAALQPVLDMLPDGLETNVGPNGSGLSGGQKQRVGIARAVLKDARVFVFDEATSALDVENERRIMERLSAGFADKIVLFATHRPATLAYVDKILMLDHGKVVAFGPQQQLEAENESYQNLFAAAMDDTAEA
ncbi:ABC transporter ATP-binding protein [Actibacterium pelagium]|uniref:ABC transporter ATP-binding protein n=1 Tax=Actibacterium pelagium TaxID=2029103 RepID=UPI001304244D|nr:ABC transporter ATP-binding protein [Actibacterium pelagium]